MTLIHGARVYSSSIVVAVLTLYKYSRNKKKAKQTAIILSLNRRSLKTLAMTKMINQSISRSVSRLDNLIW